MAIERILERLTGEEKALLAMRYEDEMTYEELAYILGKEVSAVRQWFSRLHRRLRLEEKNVEDILC
jgi:RNA polymerase sigma factor (sigma-70 family)